MTEQDGDPEDLRRVSRRYRALGAEEPPRALDEAILAAARREVGARPGAPGRAAPQRWAGSLAAAAVLVLAVAVALHMQSEQPDVAQPVPAAKLPAVPPAAPVNEPVKQAAKPVIPKAAEFSRKSEPEPFPAKEEHVTAERQIPPAPQASAAAPSAEMSSRADAARAPQAAPARALARSAGAQGKVQADTPERELERIAELRRQGRHDEADKALAEFRKRYPEFRIPDEMRARVERR
jgi:hypothetical protein